MRSLHIEHPFLEGATSRLGLIDLPGAGEAGLDVDRQFVQRVKDEVDLLLMVKRPLPNNAGWFRPDDDTLTLVDAARVGTALEDFFVILLNRDEQHDPDGALLHQRRHRGRADRRRAPVARAPGPRQLPRRGPPRGPRPVLSHPAESLDRIDRIANLFLTAINQAGPDCRADKVCAEAPLWVPLTTLQGHSRRVTADDRHSAAPLLTSTDVHKMSPQSP